MTSLPRREKRLPRPKPKDQDRFRALRPAPALGVVPRATVKSNDYLFINKGQASESLSNCKTNKTQTAINAHVQRFKPHHFALLRDIGDRSRLPIGENRGLDPSSLQWQSEAAGEDGEASTTDNVYIDILSPRPDHGGGRQVGVPPLYSNNFMEGDAFDPFRGTAVPIDQPTHTVLQFFLRLGWKAHLRNIGRADQLLWSESFGDVSGMIRGCLSNKMHMYAFLAFAPKRMAIYGGSPMVTTESPAVSLGMSKALQALREHFAQLSAPPMDQQVLLDIIWVSLAEFFRRNFAAVRTHLRMLRYIVKEHGGFSNVSQYIREVCCYTELCFALRMGEMPVFELTWDPGSARCNRELQDKSASWPAETKASGSGFQSPLREGFFDGTTRAIIEELVDDIPALEYVRNDAEAAPANSQWACIRSRAILHRLMSVRTPGQQASLQEQKVHCVIVALIKLLGYENLCVAPIRYPEAVVRRLMNALEVSSSDFSQQGSWGRHNDMLLWIMITGIRISRGSEDEGWFMSRAVQGCRILGLENYDHLHGLVRKFIWVENRQCPALMKLAGHTFIAKAEELDSRC